MSGQRTIRGERSLNINDFGGGKGGSTGVFSKIGLSSVGMTQRLFIPYGLDQEPKWRNLGGSIQPNIFHTLRQHGDHVVELRRRGTLESNLTPTPMSAGQAGMPAAFRRAASNVCLSLQSPYWFASTSSGAMRPISAGAERDGDVAKLHRHISIDGLSFSASVESPAVSSLALPELRV